MKVQSTVRFLSGKTGSFPDAKTGEIVNYGSVWFFDGDQAIQAKLDRQSSYGVADLNRDLVGLNPWDEVIVEVDVSSGGVRLHGIKKAK